MQSPSADARSLYVILDQSWTETQSTEFVNTVLPHLHEWYLRSRSSDAVIGVLDRLLVKRNSKELRFHELHSA